MYLPVVIHVMHENLIGNLSTVSQRDRDRINDRTQKPKFFIVCINDKALLALSFNNDWKQILLSQDSETFFLIFKMIEFSFLGKANVS